jgi:hypothetical protein
MNGHESLGAILVRLTERQAEIDAQADRVREQIEQLAAHLSELDQQREHLAITRKTLTELDFDGPPTVPALMVDMPEHSAYQQILTALGEADRPLRAREICEAIDLPTTNTNINNVRGKVKRLVSLNLAAEAELGLFTSPRP